MAVTVNVLSEARTLSTTSGRTLYVLDGMLGDDLNALLAACYSKSCAPPPVGVGGSSKGGSLRHFPLDASDPELISMVGSALARRISRDMEEESGPVWEAVWRRDRKMSADAEMLALADGQRDAVARLVRHKIVRSEYEPSDDQEMSDAIGTALTELESNRPFRDAVSKFGEVPIVLAKSIGGGASGKYLTDAIILSEMAGTSSKKPIGELVVDAGLDGTIRHEYGHHIESIAPSAALAKFREAHGRWPGRLGGPAEVDRVIDAGEVDGHWPTHGISVYARTNGKEAFAEVFAMVTHPDFKREDVAPEAAEMVDAMLEILK